MRKFLSLLLLAGLASAKPPPTIRVVDVRSVSVVGTTLVVMLHGSVYTSEISDVTFSGDSLTLTGSFAETGTTGDGDYREYSYVDTNGGTQLVHTDCKGLSSQPCAEKHKAAVDSNLKLFPPK